MVTQSIYLEKAQAVTDTPLLVFDCVLMDGTAEHWSTHAVTVDGTAYAARVLQQNVFQMQTASSQGVDGIPGISLTLANADSHFSQLEQAIGFKGALLSVSFLFYNLPNNAAATDVQVIFKGICNPSDERREATFRLSAGNRMNLQRLLLPEVRIQRRCPWNFPETEAERVEAIAGGANGQYSRYYRCGYSAGETGGSGNLNNGSPYTDCGYVQGDCQERGMWLNFGGIEYVPPAIAVRSYGDKNYHTSALSVNAVLYNDYVPMVYGTAWYAPPVVFARNDGNLTRMEVLLGIGPMQGVLTVLVNDVAIPLGVADANMTGTGWYNIPTLGTRTGACDPNFTDGNGQPAGDPYGSMAYLAVVVPNRLNDGTALPTVKVLVQGLLVPVYGTDGTAQGTQFTNNPAWVLLDILRRMGWSAADIDVASFGTAAAYCGEQLSTMDLNGNPIMIPRFECNLALQNRRSAGDLTRAVRTAARLQLNYAANGGIACSVENTIAVQQPSQLKWSNSAETANAGWPSYEFGDGSNGFSGILRRATGEPSIRVYSRSIADTPNCYSVEFQDELNDYQQDGYSLADPDDLAISGQEVSARLNAIGIANYDQAGRALQLALNQSIYGNVYIDFDTSVQAFGIRPGDLITVTYQKEGFDRQIFRVLKIAPGTNHRTMTITAQIHDDDWYADTAGQSTTAPGGRRQDTAAAGIPRPLVGSLVDANGNIQYGIAESDTTASDGTVQASVSVSFVPPAAAGIGVGPGIPLLSLAATIGTGGTLQGRQTLYYGITGVDVNGNEGGMSFLAMAAVAANGSTVTLSRLSFAAGTATFNVYRGTTTAELLRIATGNIVAAQFTDTGLGIQLISPPDPNFDHGNFYWRMELVPEMAVTAQLANAIGNGTLEMTANQYRGAVVRITRGTGAGQERTISANTATTLTLASPWVVVPDASSFFTVAECGWKFGALARSSPVNFAIPNLGGETVEIMGCSANANDVECPQELSTVSRWQIGGQGAGGDSAVPPTPIFGLGTGPSEGTVGLSGVSFTDLTNTHTISAGTLTLHYRDELAGASGILLTAMAATDTALTLNTAGNASAGSFLQVDAEVMLVQSAQGGPPQYTVTRGMHGTTPQAHAAQAVAYYLLSQVVIVPFAAGFFGSAYSGSWQFPVILPDARVASAELFVTNSQGNSSVGSIHLTNNDSEGLRTFSGGQYSIQVPGFLAVNQSAAPPLIVETSHAVRDIYAVLGQAADAPVTVQLNVNGAAYCPVTFVTGQTISNATNGSGLPALQTGVQVTLSVLAVGQTKPGANLTVIIRL